MTALIKPPDFITCVFLSMSLMSPKVCILADLTTPLRSI